MSNEYFPFDVKQIERYRENSKNKFHFLKFISVSLTNVLFINFTIPIGPITAFLYLLSRFFHLFVIHPHVILKQVVQLLFIVRQVSAVQERTSLLTRC